MNHQQRRKKIWFDVDTSLMLKAGTRSSNLALIQTASALRRIEKVFPSIEFKTVPFSSPGDRDLKTDLRISEGDFFTKDLDQAVLSGKLDCAVHSAKDLPETLPDELGMFLLPWKEDPRDVMIFSEKFKQNPHDKPVIGVSSNRREAFCKKRYPNCIMKSIRGDIETRLAQLDSEDYDIVIMASAALIRLNMTKRIDEWISLEKLPAPERQGVLAVTYHNNNRFMRTMSRFFKKQHLDPCCLSTSTVMLTCSEKLMQKSVEMIKEYRGIPIETPLIKLVPTENCFEESELSKFDWLILTSPTAVSIFLSQVSSSLKLPKIAVCGPGTEKILVENGMKADLVADTNFGSQGMVDALQTTLTRDDKVLRFCSDYSSGTITSALNKMGCDVDERTLYKNIPRKIENLPDFDVVFFASSSAIKAFVEQWGTMPLDRKIVITIGEPTFKTACKLMPDCHALMASKATVKGMVATTADLIEFRELLLRS